jgi:exoribonuclease-2
MAEAILASAVISLPWFHPPIEGRLLHGHEGVDVGNRLRVQLIHTDVEKGFIDFKKSPRYLPAA